MDSFFDKITQKFSAQDMIKANSEAEEKELKRIRDQIAEYDKRLEELKKLNSKLEEYVNDSRKGLNECIKAAEAKLSSFEAPVIKETEVPEDVFGKQAAEAAERAALTSKEALDAAVKAASLAEEAENSAETAIAAARETLETARRNSSGIEEIKGLASGIEELKGLAGRIEELKGMLGENEQLTENFTSFKDEMLLADKNLKNEINDFVHKEDVKVYRNVQASVEENANKVIEAIDNKKNTNVVYLIFIILTFGCSVASLVISILHTVGIL